VYVDDLSTAQNNIKTGCYGEAHRVIADDICVFYPSTRGLQSILDVCQAYAELHWNYFQLHYNFLYEV